VPTRRKTQLQIPNFPLNDIDMRYALFWMPLRLRWRTGRVEIRGLVALGSTTNRRVMPKSQNRERSCACKIQSHFKPGKELRERVDFPNLEVLVHVSWATKPLLYQHFEARNVASKRSWIRETRDAPGKFPVDKIFLHNPDWLAFRRFKRGQRVLWVDLQYPMPRITHLHEHDE